MTTMVMQCNVCLEKNEDCQPYPYDWNGLKFVFTICRGCHSLLGFAALAELRALRDEIYEDLNKPKEAEEPEPEEPTLEDYVENPPSVTVELDPEALREALHGHEADETETDD